MEKQNDLLGEVIDYTLCGYLGELVCCDADCLNCNDDDKYINKAVYEHKYGDKGEILQSKKHSREKRRIQSRNR